MGIWDFVDRLVDVTERNYRQNAEFRHTLMRLEAEREAIRRGKSLLGDGAWHSERDVFRALGPCTHEILELLLSDGNSFEARGGNLRMIGWELMGGPRSRGSVKVLPLMTKTITAAVPNTEPATARIAEEPATENTRPSPAARDSVQRSRPAEEGPHSTPSKGMTSCAEDVEAEAKDVSVEVQVASAEKTVRVTTPEPESAIQEVVAQPSAGDSGSQSMTSSSSSAPAVNPSFQHPLASGAQPSGVQVGQPSRLPEKSTAGTYWWADTPDIADLIARGVVMRRGRELLAVDVVKERRVIARMALAEIGTFFDFYDIGLEHVVFERGRESSRCDSIACAWIYHPGSGLKILDKDLRSVAPKIVSFREAMRLRKYRSWLLPSCPVKDDRRFAIRSRSQFTISLPMVVNVSRRKTSEPVAKVHFCGLSFREESPHLLFEGEAFMAWSAAIALARYTEVGVKIALPHGGWMPGKLAADFRKSEDGKEFGRGLHLRLDSIPESARRWAGRFQSIFELPLSQDRDHPVLDWSQGFPPRRKRRPPRRRRSSGE